MALRLITGNTGNDITPNDDAALHKAILGVSNYIAGASGLNYTVVDNNTIKIMAFSLFVDGKFIYLDQAQEVKLESGTQGVTRIDSIYVKIEKNSTTNIETVSLGVKKGTSSTVSPTLTNTELVTYIKLYNVKIEGINITTVASAITLTNTLSEATTGLADNAKSIEELKNKLATANATLATIEKFKNSFTKYTDDTVGIGYFKIGDLIINYDNNIFGLSDLTQEYTTSYMKEFPTRAIGGYCIPVTSDPTSSSISISSLSKSSMSVCFKRLRGSSQTRVYMFSIGY